MSVWRVDAGNLIINNLGNIDRPWWHGGCKQPERPVEAAPLRAPGPADLTSALVVTAPLRASSARCRGSSVESSALREERAVLRLTPGSLLRRLLSLATCASEYTTVS